MAHPRVLVLRAPGTNCDVETAYAFQQAGAVPERLHVNRLLERPRLLEEYQVLCIPGGFSYGDDLAAGRILGEQMRRRLFEPLCRFRDQDKLIVGICNGFQVLLKSGILLEEDAQHGPIATLAWNDSGRYEDRWVHLRVATDRSPLFAGIECMYLPVAHAEGKFVARDEASLARLEAAGQIVLRYAAADPGDSAPLAYPANPNGSQADVAGVCDATGRVCGLMPHPERFLDRTQHPRWTRGEAGEVGDGLAVFKNAVRFFTA